jgi:hypothetical protein
MALDILRWAGCDKRTGGDKMSLPVSDELVKFIL